MEGTSDENNFIYDPHFGETECIYCGSYNTTEQKPKWSWFKCNDCGETFRRM
jgi:transposase-like protein